jgi:hypothetical protein
LDIIAEEQLENAPETIEDPNYSFVDLLGDAIMEVYGASHKCQCTDDMIAEETGEQAKVVSESSKTVETEKPMVQLTTSTPENNWIPAMELNLLESAPIIVDTVMTPTTGGQDGDDRSGGGNSSSTASPVPVTQDDSDNIEITDKVVKYSVIIPCSVKHAMELDTENVNTLWADTIKKEIDSLLWLLLFI